MAAIAVWWSRGRGEIRVRRRRAPHVHCVACDMSLELPHASAGDRIVCTSCRAPIVVGGRRSHVKRRLRTSAGVARPSAPLRAAFRFATAAAVVALAGWYALEPALFHDAADAIAAGIAEGWSHLREFLLAG